jgi:hypothetical protein
VTTQLAKKRKFAMDMAGFALNVEVLWKYHPIRFNTTSNRGFQETNFLEICCTLDDIEPLADGCTNHENIELNLYIKDTKGT